jgi:hypothetical protein
LKEPVTGPEAGEKGGRKKCFGGAVGGVSVRKNSKPRRYLAKFGDFGGKFIGRERSFPDRFTKILLATVFR